MTLLLRVYLGFFSLKFLLALLLCSWWYTWARAPLTVSRSLCLPLRGYGAQPARVEGKVKGD